MKNKKVRFQEVPQLRMIVFKMAEIFTDIRYMFLSAILLVGLSSCGDGNGNKVSDSMDSVANKVEAGVDSLREDYRNSRDARFVRNAIESNEKELHLLRLAASKGTRKDVKSAANEMITDHEKLGKDMKDFAAKNGIEVDIESSSLEHDLDDDKMGNDWDKKWVNLMVDEHEKDVKNFEDAEREANNAELKGMVSTALPILRHHLEMAKTLQDKVK